jgi:hypothetical protein
MSFMIGKLLEVWRADCSALPGYGLGRLVDRRARSHAPQHRDEVPA